MKKHLQKQKFSVAAIGAALTLLSFTTPSKPVVDYYWFPFEGGVAQDIDIDMPPSAEDPYGCPGTGSVICVKATTVTETDIYFSWLCLCYKRRTKATTTWVITVTKP